MRWFVQIRLLLGWFFDGSCRSRFGCCPDQPKASTITDSSCTKPSRTSFESTAYCFRFLERSSTLLFHNAWSLHPTHTALIHAAIRLSKAGFHLLPILFLQQLIEDLHPLAFFTPTLKTANTLNGSFFSILDSNIRLCLFLSILFNQLRSEVLYIVWIIRRMIEICFPFRWKRHLRNFGSLRGVWLVCVLIVLVFILVSVVICILFDHRLRCSWLCPSSLSSNWWSGDKHLFFLNYQLNKLIYNSNNSILN